MKVKKPGTDQRVELKVCADGQFLTEYHLPSDTPRDGLNTVECFVPVKPNQVIHVIAFFNGTCHHSSYDLVIDGSFLMSRKTFGNNNGSMVLAKREILLADAMDCPLAKGWKPGSRPTRIYEGKLSVRKLSSHDISTLGQHEQEVVGAKRPGVGSIEVVVSMTQDMEEQYIDTEWDIQVQGWRNRRRVHVRPSGIIPDHTLDLVRNAKGAVGEKQSLRHRRDWEGTRVGTKPWARLIFYYRSKEEIELAGCVPSSDDEHALEPHQGDFHWGQRPKAKGKKGQREAEAQKQANKSISPSGVDLAGDEGEGNRADAVQPLAETTDRGEAAFAGVDADGLGSWSFGAREEEREPQQQICDQTDTPSSTSEVHAQSWSFDVLGQPQTSSATRSVGQVSGRHAHRYRINSGTSNNGITLDFDTIPPSAAAKPYEDADEITLAPDRKFDANSPQLSSKRAAAIAAKNFLVTGLLDYSHMSIESSDCDNSSSKYTQQSGVDSRAALKPQLPIKVMPADDFARKVSLTNHRDDTGVSMDYKSGIPTKEYIIAFIRDKSTTIDEVISQFLPPQPPKHTIASWDWLEAEREFKARIMAVTEAVGQDTIHLKPQFTISERESFSSFVSAEDNDETNIPEQTGLAPLALPDAQKVKQEEQFDDSSLLATPLLHTDTMAPSTSISALKATSSSHMRGQSTSMTPNAAARKPRSKTPAPSSTNPTQKRSPSMSITPEVAAKKTRAQTPLELEIAEKAMEIERVKAVIAAEKAKAAAKIARKADRAEKRRRKKEAKAEEHRAKKAEIDRQHEAKLQELMEIQAFMAQTSSSEEDSDEEASSEEY